MRETDLTIKDHVRLAASLDRALALRAQGYNDDEIAERLLPPQLHLCQLCNRPLYGYYYSDEAVCTVCGGSIEGAPDVVVEFEERVPARDETRWIIVGRFPDPMVANRFARLGNPEGLGVRARRGPKKLVWDDQLSRFIPMRGETSA